MKLPQGVEFQETMAGTWRAAGGTGPERPISFTLRARMEDLRSYLEDPTLALEGTLEMEGFADHVPLSGTLLVSPIRRRMLRYEFSFNGQDGKSYRFEGQKTLDAMNLLQSATTLPARIHDAETGAEVAQATVRFDMRTELLKMLRSFRPV